MTKRTKITVPSTVKWLSEVVVDPNCLSSSFKHYERFQFGEIEAKIGDFVLISNADAAEPDTEHGCDAAQIVSLYEDSTNQKDPFRSRVQWYTRPTDLPAWCFNNTEPIQFMHDEVIEDHRPFNTDVSIETFFKPCVITFKLTKDFSTLYRPYFDYVCRYRLMSLSKRKVIMEPVMEEERKAIQLLSSIPITPKTPTSLVKRMSRVSLSERKNWSISKAEGTKLLLKRAIFADKTEKVSPKKITPNTKTPKTSASETPKSLKKGNTNNLEDILSMELRENSDDELPTLIIRQNSGTTPKRRPSVSKQNEETPNKRQSVSKRNEQTSKIKLVFDTEKSSSTKLNNKINHLEEDVSPVQQTPRRTRNVSEAEIKIDCVQKIPVLCLEKIREPTSKTNKETPKRRQSIAKTNAETPNKKQSVSKRNVETLEINQSKKSLYTTRSSRATTSKINYAEEEPSPVKRTPRRTRKVSEAEGEKEYEPTQKMSVLRLDDESPHAFKQTPRRTRKVTETDDEFQPLPKTPKLPKTPRTPKTPAQTPQQRVCRKLISQMTPTLRTRAETVEGDGLYVKPTTKMSLPGRESQLAEILSFVKTKLLDETSGCMYISGMPGTGKTETVKLVLQMLKEDEDLPEFNLLEVNGMRIAEPRQAYVQIYKQLTGKAVVWEQACSLLEKRFTTSEPRRTPTVLLVDELDVLCTRRQDVLYSIMEWATHDTALLTVLAVANTMDLPERALAARVASRLGLTRLTFPPYTHAQLQKIVATRLAFKNVTPDAVQLISRKVAAVSGDARRALALCRRALELAGAEGAGLAQVQRALGEASSGAALQAVRRASGAERLLLRAVAAEVERTGLEETTLSRALSTAAAIVALDGRPYKAARSIRAPTPSQALAICSRLASLKLLLIEPKPAEPRLLLNISVDDVHYATRDLQV